MKEYRFKEAFLGFTKDKLKKQIDEILTAMRLNSIKEAERVREKLADYLESSIRAMNAKRKKKGKPLFQDLLDHPVYLIARMVKKSDSEEEFKSHLEEVFACREDNYYAASPSLAIRVLGPFPWAWKFPVDSVADTGEENTGADIIPPRLEVKPVSLEAIMKIIARDWPRMKALLDMSECDYDSDHGTLVILPPAPVFRDVNEFSNDLHAMLTRHFERVAIEVLNPGSVVDTEPKSQESENSARPMQAGKPRVSPRDIPVAALSAKDRADVEHILDAMQFKNGTDRDKTRIRLEMHVQNSIKGQNRRRTVAGLPHIKGVQQTPIYVFSKIIPKAKDIEDLMKRVRESFPNTPHLWNPSAVMQSVGSFPWAWGFDPKAKKTEVTRTPAAISVPDAGKGKVEALPTKTKAVQQPVEDPRLAEVNDLKTRMELLESIFRRHIHSAADGSTYIPIETANDAFASGGVAS